LANRDVVEDLNLILLKGFTPTFGDIQSALDEIVRLREEAKKPAYVVINEYYLPYDDNGPYKEVVLVTRDEAKAKAKVESYKGTRNYASYDGHDVE